jgi:hypothetical protein
MARFSVFRFFLFTKGYLISPGYPGEKTTWGIWRIYDWSIGKLTNNKEMSAADSGNMAKIVQN